jgi:tetratricopeptide (TPR) repeat protein
LRRALGLGYRRVLTMLFAPDWYTDTAQLVAEDEPPAADLFARRVHDLLERGEAAPAAKCAREGTTEFPDYATGWYLRAKAEFHLADYESSRASVEHCLALEPTFYSAWGLLETIHSRLGRAAAAVAARRRLEEERGSPDSVDEPAPPAEAQPAQAQVASPPAGPAVGSSLILVKPAVMGPFETPTLAEVYRRQGLLDRALGVYRRILERHPDDAGAKAMVHRLEDELAARRRPAEAL